MAGAGPPALVLAAGLGERLRPLTLVRAKPAIPVAGEPLIRRIVRGLVAQGVKDAVVNLHYLPDTIAAALGDGTDLGARVRYSWEQPRVLGSAGGPRQALDILGAETFFIVNGDTLTDVSLPALAADHAASGAHVTLALIPNEEPARYNGVRLDDRSRVIGFAKRGPEAVGSYHLVGVQIAQASAFRSLPPGEPIDSVRGIYDEMIATSPGAIRGFVSNASFSDIGTVRDYWDTTWRLARDPYEVQQGEGTRIDPTARVTRSVLWDDVDVGPAATLDACIVADGVKVPGGAAYRHATLVMRDGAVSAVPWE